MNQSEPTSEPSFTCKSCGHELDATFCMRTPGYCYMCDPAITLEELLKEDPKTDSATSVTISPVGDKKKEFPK